MDEPAMPPPDDERIDHGVDEYVSACNHVPFAEPLDAVTTRCVVMTCAILVLAGCGGAYILYRLIALIIH